MLEREISNLRRVFYEILYCVNLVWFLQKFLFFKFTKFIEHYYDDFNLLFNLFNRLKNDNHIRI